MNVENLKISNSSNAQMMLKKEIPDYLEHIRLIIEGKKDEKNEFGKYSKGYIKTTENINGYYRLLNFKGKKVLTVVGAGDQIFNAILGGVKKIDGFDISMNSIMLYYLKEAAIKELDYDSFIDFFYVENKCFNKETYKRIRNSLNESAIQFWDMVFEQDNPYEIVSNIINKTMMYPSGGYASMKLAQTSNYLSIEGYYELKEKINDCEITISLKDVKELDDLGTDYDYIILSNIFEYQKGEDLQEFKKAIERYRKILNTNGVVIIGYAYHDVDLTEFSEYEKRSIPSRFAAWGSLNPPEDSILISRK